MRIALVGALIGMVTMYALARAQQINRSVYQAPAPSYDQSDSRLISHFVPATSGTAHTMVVLDPTQRVLAIYHVHAATGATSLKSVRNLEWDLQMIHFNSEAPSPQDVRNGLHQEPRN